jgi:two-component system, NtrC family, phosphoglycerate transport system response regulator PgtA
MKVLVVDDDREQRELRSMLLERSGFDALSASDRTSAKDLAAEHHFSAAVIDLGLPAVEDGLELIRDLKALDSGMRVIVLTGSGKSTLRSALEPNLVDRFFTKPASTAELIRALRSYEGTG